MIAVSQPASQYGNQFLSDQKGCGGADIVDYTVLYYMQSYRVIMFSAVSSWLTTYRILSHRITFNHLPSRYTAEQSYTVLLCYAYHNININTNTHSIKTHRTF